MALHPRECSWFLDACPFVQVRAAFLGKVTQILLGARLPRSGGPPPWVLQGIRLLRGGVPGVSQCSGVLLLSCPMASLCPLLLSFGGCYPGLCLDCLFSPVLFGSHSVRISPMWLLFRPRYRGCSFSALPSGKSMVVQVDGSGVLSTLTVLAVYLSNGSTAFCPPAGCRLRFFHFRQCFCFGSTFSVTWEDYHLVRIVF